MSSNNDETVRSSDPDQRAIGESTSRRRFIASVAAVGTVAGVAGVGGIAMAQDGSTTIKLGGEVPGWQGQAPSSIKGKTNPTLEFTAGEKVAVTWTNLDGAPHNFQVLDSDGNVLHKTETMSDKGSSQTANFTATKEMTEYNCVVHPTSMRGDVSVTGGSAQNETQTATENETTTETTTTANETTTAANETTTSERPTPAETPTQTFKLAFENDTWTGQSPSTIEGKTNPTLKLKPGQTYRVTWVNREPTSSPTNQRPNFTVLSAKEEVNDVVRTDYLSKKGATQTVDFVATSDLSSYLAEAYPNAEGEIYVSGETEDQQQGNGKAKTGNGKAKTGNGNMSSN